MQFEIRADSLHIDGYVNVTGKLSRPIVTPRGRVLETVEPRAFDEAIRESGEVTLTLDHKTGHIYATTLDGTLKLREDAIGLHAEVTVTDPDVIEMARKGKIKGWSFGMYNVRDEMESRGEDKLPIRHVTGMLLDHVSLIKDKQPCYAATSVEVRAEGDLDVEIRGTELPEPEIINQPDYSGYEERIRRITHEEAD